MPFELLALRGPWAHLSTEALEALRCRLEAQAIELWRQVRNVEHTLEAVKEELKQRRD